MLLLASSCLATTRTAKIQTSSPYGIEQTILKIATGMTRDSAITQAFKAGENDLAVWVDDDKLDVKVLSNINEIKQSFKTFTDNVSVDNGMAVLNRSADLVESVLNLIVVERKLREFITSKDPVDGSVTYSYSFWYNGTLVRRYTKITDDHIYLRTNLHGNMAQLNWAMLEINAVEGTTGSTITGTLTANTSIGNRCGLVRRIASRKMDELMTEKLWEINSRARAIAAEGQHEFLPAIQQFISSTSNKGLGYGN